MKEIDATIPKYQPFASFMVLATHPSPMKHCFQPDLPITRELVPSLFEEPMMRSSSKLVQSVF